jgi:hypothetical protein
MNQNDPFPAFANVETKAVDPEVLLGIATRLAAARQNPPTMFSLLTKWSGTPLLFLIGVVGTVVLVLLSDMPNSAITSEWVFGFAAFVSVAVLRDFGFARCASRLWKPQSHFIDWQKVDEFKA